MINLPLSVLSLLILRLFSLLVLSFSAWFVWLGWRKGRQSRGVGWRWALFSFAFAAIGMLAYIQMLSPALALRAKLDPARPRQPRAVYHKPGRTMFFWETVQPLTGFVRYGFSPHAIDYLAKPEELIVTKLHSVVFDEPIPPTGLYVVVYSGGKKYFDSSGEPFYLPKK